jgi:hypothetical protein
MKHFKDETFNMCEEIKSILTSVIMISTNYAIENNYHILSWVHASYS